MEELRCGLCDQPVGDDAHRIVLRPEDWAWLEDDLSRRIGGRTTAIIERAREQAVTCARCAALPKEEARRLVPEMWARLRRRIASGSF